MSTDGEIYYVEKVGEKFRTNVFNYIECLKANLVRSEIFIQN